jgi:hypothetical protein
MKSPRVTDSGGGYASPVFRRPSLLGVVYIVVGVAVAASHEYLENLDTARRLLSALLAIALWPLLLLGIDLHVRN